MLITSAARGARLRFLGPAHAAAMGDMERQCFSRPWSEAQCRAAFAQPAFAALGVFCGETPLGYLSVYHTPGEMEILNVAVLPRARRRGLGRRLLRVALRLARKMGMHRALLEVRAGNRPAIALYEGCGFVRAGLRRGYYADTGEDALIYVRAI